MVAEATGTISSGVDNPVAGAEPRPDTTGLCSQVSERRGVDGVAFLRFERFLAVSLVRFRLMTVALLHRAARSGHRGCSAAKSERAERPERTRRDGYV